MVDYALLLTRRPREVKAHHVELLREAGLSNEEVHRVAAIVAYFNFVNRIAEGLGVELEPETPRARGNHSRA
jgi:alkylhydroperoxidase family enzyme